MNRDVHDNMVTAATTTLETLKIIDTHGVPIGFVHDDGVLSGTVTDGDIRRGILAGEAMDMPNLLQRLLDDGKKPTVFPLRGYWMDIGRFNDLDQAKRDYAGLFTEDSAAADHDTTGKNS